MDWIISSLFRKGPQEQELAQCCKNIEHIFRRSSHTDREEILEKLQNIIDEHRSNCVSPELVPDRMKTTVSVHFGDVGKNLDKEAIFGELQDVLVGIYKSPLRFKKDSPVEGDIGVFIFLCTSRLEVENRHNSDFLERFNSVNFQKKIFIPIRIGTRTAASNQIQKEDHFELWWLNGTVKRNCNKPTFLEIANTLRKK